MRTGRRAPWVFWLPAGVLIAIFLAQSFLASSNKSPVFDETGDIAAGLSYVQNGEVRANLQHPPLLKELAGATLWLAGVRLPDSPQVRQMLADGGGERTVGAQLIAANGPDRTMFLARLPFILLAAALGVLLCLWGRQLLGEVAALGALFLYTLSPAILGHGYLATMDVGLAAFTVLFLFALWHYLERPDARRLVCCGLAMGLMLCTKFSAVFLLPVSGVLLLPAASRAKAGRNYSPTALACIVMGAISTLVIQAAYLSPGGLFLYATGMQRVNADHNPDYLVFLGGQLAHRFASYFAAAYLLKEPVAAMLLCGVGLWAIRGSATSRRVKWFLLLPPAVLFAAHTLFADNLGMRYIIPVLPFAYLVGGAGAAWLIRQGTWGRAVTAALGLWMLAAALGVYPDHLSYFNEAACLANPGAIGLDGGTRCGPLWLDDSNVDWGQSLKQVRDWVDSNAKGEPVHLAYFGSFPPSAYGLNAQLIGPEQLARDPEAGIYLVSAHFVARSQSAWLRTPTEIIGHAMYVYRVPAAPRPAQN